MVGKDCYVAGVDKAAAAAGAVDTAAVVDIPAAEDSMAAAAVAVEGVHGPVGDSNCMDSAAAEGAVEEDMTGIAEVESDSIALEEARSSARTVVADILPVDAGLDNTTWLIMNEFAQEGANE